MNFSPGQLCLGSSLTTITGSVRNDRVEIQVPNVRYYSTPAETTTYLFYSFIIEVARQAGPGGAISPSFALPSTFNLNVTAPNRSQGMAIILDTAKIVSTSYLPRAVASTQPIRVQL